MDDIFREVDEEVRRDKALQFWTRYQNYIIALMVLIVAAAGAWRWNADRERAAAEAAGSQFEAALALSRDNKPAEAEAAFQDIIRQGHKGYALLARMRGAAELASTDAPKAVSIYDAIATDSTVPALLQDVARLRAAMLRLDEADADELKRRLESLAKPTAPFRNSAREMLAYGALKAKDYDAAARWLDEITTDRDAPAGMRQRADTLLGLVAGAKAR
jgi:hypothetical protein